MHSWPQEHRDERPEAVGMPSGNCGLVALFGNLVPQEALLKRAAADPALFEREGRAVVFESLGDLGARIDDAELDVKPNDFLVLKNAGPASEAAMPEAGYLPIPAKLAREGIGLRWSCEGAVEQFPGGT